MKIVIEVSQTDVELIRSEMRNLQSARYQDVSSDAIYTVAILKGLREMVQESLLSKHRKQEDAIIKRGLFEVLLSADMG